MSTIQFPEKWKGRVIYSPEAVSVLEMVLFMREQIRGGVRPEAFIGRLDINALSAFIQGMLFVSKCHQKRDEYGEFFEWLRDVKGECPQYVGGGAWARSSLEACGGDHHAAILRFLDLAAEFAELKKASRKGCAEKEGP